jgi:hypothetical protein
VAGEGKGAAAVGDFETAAQWLSSMDASELDAEELGPAVLGMERLLNAAYALSAVLLDGFDREGGWAADGALCAAQWVAERTGTSVRVLRARLRQGADLRLLPALAERARAGRLSPEHLRTVGDCTRRHAGLVIDHEMALVEQSETLDADRFAVMVRQWLARTAATDAANAAAHPLAGASMGGERAEARETQSRLHASRTLEGCLRLHGWFTPADADLLDAALGAGLDRQLRAAANGDPSVVGRPVPELRATALVDLVAQSMRREPSDLSVPDRYRVALVVRPGETTSPAEVTCDNVAYRVVLDAKGEVLDVGRQSPRWPSAIRRGITVRDGGCVFPGCDRPPSWSDVHHCTPYSEKGATSVDNGTLLCRRHHTFIHARHWRVTINDGKPVVRRPDGQPHTIQRWPSAPGGDVNRTRGSPTALPD